MKLKRNVYSLGILILIILVSVLSVHAEIKKPAFTGEKKVLKEVAYFYQKERLD